jgi:hypothetical protein
MNCSAKAVILVLLSVSMLDAQRPAAIAEARVQAPAALRSILLSQLHSVHDHAEWFFPLDKAIAGLTPEQANWVPKNAAGELNPNADHSVGSLAYHLFFWNSNALAQLRHERPTGPSTNDETFNDFDAASWTKLTHDLNAVMVSLEQIVEHADDAELLNIAPMIERISTHTAYHTGQIFYVRKLQGTWKQDNDVPK